MRYSITAISHTHTPAFHPLLARQAVCVYVCVCVEGRVGGGGRVWVECVEREQEKRWLKCDDKKPRASQIQKINK